MADSEYKPNGKIWFLVILVLLIFGGSLLYFGRKNGIDEFRQANISGTVAPRQTRVYTVYYNTGVFSPTNIRVHAGDSVKFLNESTDQLHIVSDSTDGAPDLVGFDSIGNVPPNGTFAYTFIEAGSFGYHNDLNKAERGMIIVRPQ